MRDPSQPPTYVVVCRGPHCREHGSRSLRERLVALLRHRRDIRLLGYNCFGQCERGPNVAFYPEAAWFGGLSQPGDAERVVEHAAGGRALPAERLVLPPEEEAAHRQNIEELVQAVTPRAQGTRARWRLRWPLSR